MNIGNGIAILGVWIFAAIFSMHNDGLNMLVGIIIALGVTIALTEQ